MLETESYQHQAQTLTESRKAEEVKPFTKCQLNIKDLLNEIETQVYSQEPTSSRKAETEEYKYTQFGFGNMREVSESSN